MPCNCPGSGCQCVDASSATISVSGIGSPSNPYIHSARISLAPCNQLAAVADGLFVPGVVPTGTVTSGNLLVEHAGCGVDRLEDPPQNRVLRGLPSGASDAAWRPFISTQASNAATAGADGGVFVPVGAGGGSSDPRLDGGGVCQFLGNSSPGNPDWVDPNLCVAQLYSDAIVASLANVAPVGTVNQTVSQTNFAAYTNVGSCSLMVMFHATLYVEDYPNAPSANLLYAHRCTLSADRNIFGVPSAADTGGHIVNQVATFNDSGNISHETSVTTWSRVDPGQTVNWSFHDLVTNNAGGHTNGFTSHLRNATVLAWRI